MINILYKVIFILTVASSCSAWGETKEQVAKRARSLLHDPNNYAVGILSTIYPSNYSDPYLRETIASGPEYFAPCYENGDLFMLAMPVSQNWRNALHSSRENNTATISISSSANPSIPDPRHTSPKNAKEWNQKRPEWRKGMPSKQRITLFGHFEKVQEEIQNLANCYHSYHPDAKHWSPGSKEKPHFVFWTRFVVERIYRVGGFGDESNIGWIDLDDWQKSGSGSFEYDGYTADDDEKDVLSIKNLFEEDHQSPSRFYIQN